MPRAKKAKKRRAVVIDRIGPKILQDLVLTDLPAVKIARKYGVTPKTVVAANKKYGIRSPEIMSAIRSRTISASRIAYIKKTRGKKVHFFTKKKKLDLLEENKGLIIKVTREAWSSDLIRKEFNQEMRSLLQAVEVFILDNLDYYNPKVKGYMGKTTKPSTWIYNGAKVYCRSLYTRLHRIKENKTMPFDSAGLPIAQTGEVRQVKGIRRTGLKEVQWIPSAANALLKKLGLDPNKVAKLGYIDLKQQIIEIAKAKQTGLTSRELEAVKLTLNGKTMAQIGKKFGTVRQVINYLETRAAKKIKNQLALKQAKK